MECPTCSPRAVESVRQLEAAYAGYMTALAQTVALGEEVIPALVAVLNHKRANPIAKALGLLMALPQAEAALPHLLDWVVGAWPIYPDAVEAVVRAGVRALPHVLARLDRSAAAGDDEAVRNLLDVARQLPEAGGEALHQRMLHLLRHDNPHIREAVADSFWRMGLAEGRAAIPLLTELAHTDAEEAVRIAAAEALARLS